MVEHCVSCYDLFVLGVFCFVLFFGFWFFARVAGKEGFFDLVLVLGFGIWLIPPSLSCEALGCHGWEGDARLCFWYPLFFLSLLIYLFTHHSPHQT